MAIKVQNLINQPQQSNYNNLYTIAKQTDVLGDRYASLLKKYESKSNNANKKYQFGTSISGIGGTIFGLGASLLGGNAILSSGVGSLASGVINYFVSRNYYNRIEDVNDIEKKANATQNAQLNLAKYGESLSERDTAIEDAMNTVSLSLSSMMSSYGSDFVNNLYNFYLAQSGIDENSYSILAGNYNTFKDSNLIEDNGFGLSDITKDVQANAFFNKYSVLTEENLGEFRTLLVNNLIGSDTETGIALRTYQQELEDLMNSYDFSIGELTAEVKQSLDELSTEQRENNISDESSLGSASAKRAISGLRGATSVSNEKLIQLQKTMKGIKFAANANIILSKLRAEAQRLTSNASIQAYQYQQNMKAQEKRNVEASIQSLNALAISVKKTEEQANTALQSAEQYKKELGRYTNEYMNDEDTIWSLVN